MLPVFLKSDHEVAEVPSGELPCFFLLYAKPPYYKPIDGSDDKKESNPAI